jgi:hypothetical protein
MSTSILTLPSSNWRYQIMLEMYDSISAITTPGLVEFIEKNSRIKDYLDAITDKIDQTILDIPEVAVKELAATYVKGVRRACERHAEAAWEAHRSGGQPPGDLDLRFMRHVSLKFHMTMDDGSEYYLFGKTPEPLPGAGIRWATAQDWLDVLSHDTAVTAVQMFGYPLNAKRVMAVEPPPEAPPSSPPPFSPEPQLTQTSLALS